MEEQALGGKKPDRRHQPLRTRNGGGPEWLQRGVPRRPLAANNPAPGRENTTAQVGENDRSKRTGTRNEKVVSKVDVELE